MEDGAGQRKRVRSVDENGDAEDSSKGDVAADATSGAGTSVLPPLDEFDDAPRVRRGADADLGGLRRALAVGFDPALSTGAVDGEGAETGDDDGVDDGPDEGYEGPQQHYHHHQQFPEDEEERIMLHLPAFSTSFVAGGPSSLSSPSDGFRDAPGDVVVTTRRLFFVAGEPSDERDLAIDAGCVSLHAMSSEGLPGRGAGEEVWHVYCQLAGGGCHEEEGDVGAVAMAARGIDPVEPDLESGDGDYDGDDIGDVGSGSGVEGGGPTEVYFAPVSNFGGDEPHTKGRCQRLFDALSRLAAMNPIFDDDDEYGGGGGGAGGGGLEAMMSLMAGLEGNGHSGNGWVVAGEDEDANYSDGDEEMVFRIGDGDQGDDYENDIEGGATAEEREAMLQRLDDMLIVPKELEIPSDDEGPDQGGNVGNHIVGQFDDAEEE